MFFCQFLARGLFVLCVVLPAFALHVHVQVLVVSDGFPLLFLHLPVALHHEGLVLREHLEDQGPLQLEQLLPVGLCENQVRVRIGGEAGFAHGCWCYR
jgi:hypothetical protein